MNESEIDTSDICFNYYYFNYKDITNLSRPMVDIYKSKHDKEQKEQMTDLL